MKKTVGGMLVLGTLIVSAVFVGCGKEKFVYYFEQDDAKVTKSFLVKDIVGSAALDILWVIDNSGSMGQHQKNVIANSSQFIQALVAGRARDWKIGLVSTFVGDKDYIPFGKPGELNSKTPDPVGVFNAAVRKLGTNRGCYEVAFQPVLDYLARYPTFTSKRAPLAIIIVTDTDEENVISPTEFIDRVAAVKGDRKITAYGVFGYNEFKCAGERRTDFGGPIPDWSDGRYKPLIEATNGAAYSLCDPKFGLNLAEIGDQLSKFATQSMLFLPDRPITESLEVRYEGKTLPGGPQEQGGLWFYDPFQNAVVFYTLDFAPDEMSRVQVSFRPDRGFG